MHHLHSWRTQPGHGNKLECVSGGKTIQEKRSDEAEFMQELTQVKRLLFEL